MNTETRVECVCGANLQIINSQHDATTWADCPQCERSSNPFDIGTPGNTVLADFRDKYKNDYLALDLHAEE